MKQMLASAWHPGIVFLTMLFQVSYEANVDVNLASWRRFTGTMFFQLNYEQMLTSAWHLGIVFLTMLFQLNYEANVDINLSSWHRFPVNALSIEL